MTTLWIAVCLAILAGFYAFSGWIGVTFALAFMLAKPTARLVAYLYNLVLYVHQLRISLPLSVLLPPEPPRENHTRRPTAVPDALRQVQKVQ